MKAIVLQTPRDSKCRAQLQRRLLGVGCWKYALAEMYSRP